MVGDEISVCVLTYNHAHVIESTLSTIQRQSIDGFEIVVSDDHSTDGTWEVVQRVADADPRIRAVRTPCNLGMAGNANFAISLCERPYIAILHHDDLYAPNLLERWLEVMQTDHRISFVFNAYRVDGTSIVHREAVASDSVDGLEFLEKYLLARWGCPVRGTAMIRRDAWIRVGGMREKFNLLADVDLWMRLSVLGRVGYVSEPLVVVRRMRPENYPEEYTTSGWSWRRQRILYEIHGENWRDFLVDRPLRRVRWLYFRYRVSLESIKWLLYGVLRRKAGMISESQEGATGYDLLPLRAFRFMLRRLYKH